MIDIGFFYLLLLILLLLLLFIIILYKGGHSRTIAPPLMNSFYGVSTSTANIDASWKSLELIDGSAIGTSGGLEFNNSAVPFEFVPLSADRSRDLNGKLTIYAQSEGSSIHFKLRMKDDGKIIGDSTNYVLYPGTSFGLQKIELIFDAKNLDDDKEHNFILEAQSRSPTTTIPGTSMLINSSFFTYI